MKESKLISTLSKDALEAFRTDHVSGVITLLMSEGYFIYKDAIIGSLVGKIPMLFLDRITNFTDKNNKRDLLAMNEERYRAASDYRLLLRKREQEKEDDDSLKANQQDLIEKGS